MLILGVHRDPYHNTGAAVIHDDGNSLKVIAISQERLDRIKDSAEYPDHAIDYCLKAFGAEGVDDCDLIVSDYIYRPEWNNDRASGIRNALSSLKRSTRRIGVKHPIPPNKVHFVNHHMAHACSAFYPSDFEDAAILVVDGHGTIIPGIGVSQKSPDGVFETQSLFVGNRGSDIERIEFTSKAGVGMLYSAFTHFLGFGHLQDGKTMGLAPYGKFSTIRHIEFPKKFDGIETDYSNLSNIWAKEGEWVKQKDLVPCTDKTLQTNDYYSRIAWEVQDETERAMVHCARHAKNKTGKNHLCIAGGTGLNSVANYKIYQEKFLMTFGFNLHRQTPAFRLDVHFTVITIF